MQTKAHGVTGNPSNQDKRDSSASKPNDEHSAVARTGSNERRGPHRHGASLTNRIFLALLGVSVVAVVLAGFASTVVYQGSVQDDAQAQLAREANMLSQVLDRNVAVTTNNASVADGAASNPRGSANSEANTADDSAGTDGAGAAMDGADTADAGHSSTAAAAAGNATNDADAASADSGLTAAAGSATNGAASTSNISPSVADDVPAEDEASVLAALDLGDLRATLIDDDGTVLYDSETDAADLPNHADRPEVASAFANGTGSIVRSSNTVGNVSIYYAVRLNSGHVLRLALDRAGVMALLRRDTGMLFLVALALVLLSWIVAHTLSRRLVRPVINMYPALQPEKRVDSLRSSPAGSPAASGGLTADVAAGTSGRLPADVVPTASTTLTTDAASTVETALLDRPGTEVAPVVGPEASSRFATDDLPADEASELSAVRVVSPYRELDPLTNRINSQRERLSRQMRQLQEASVMRSEFTANVTHELKTPLQSISGASELIAEGMVEPEDIPDFARRIYSEARRLTNLVNDILTLSKLDDVERSGSSSYHETTEPVDLFAVAHDVEQRLGPKANDSEVELTLDGSRVVVRGIPRLLDELVYNLVDNAIRYNHEGGYVRVWAGSLGGRPTLRVSDSGIGIAPADQDKIFERFYRVEKSRSRASGGTGLGLAIVKHAATYHHASVDVSSKLGEGSTFTVTFPHGM